MDVVFSVCIVKRGAVGALVWEVWSVLSCRCCMFVSCVHPVAVLNDAFSMTCSFVNAGCGCKRRPYRRGILQSRSHNCFVGNHEGLLLFTPPSCYSEYFYDLWVCLYIFLGCTRACVFGCDGGLN